MIDPTNPDDAMRLLEEHASRERAKQAQQRAAETVKAISPNVDACGIPPKFRDARLDGWAATTPEQSAVLSRVSRFAERFPEAKRLSASMLFTGGVGTGKTTLACALVRAVADAGHSAMYVHQVAKWLRSVKESFSPDTKEQPSDLIQRLVEPDLLVLDEVGVQYRTPAELTLITELVDDRYCSQRATVLVSNLPGAELQQLVGERAADRLGEFGATLVFSWGSFRQRKRGVS